ncbi:netrin receptor UNC5C-like isoform X2 [Symsagittifera roscoffensis]|uniref:netrin receptor UNC5C-like isoform X2 n=1 Tax=Symsagittifera roscoffensis TaxID=84072 RepID=UPI00307BE4EA
MCSRLFLLLSSAVRFVAVIGLGGDADATINKRPTTAGEPRIISMSDLMYLDEQNSVTLTCTVTSDPAPVHLSFQCGERHYPIDDLDKPDEQGPDSKSFKMKFENSFVRETMELSASKGGTGDSMKCVCRIFSRSGRETTSEPAEIRKATLDSHFFFEPKSQAVLRGESVTLRCVPPTGDPAPRMTWERNGRELKPEKNKYRFSDEKGTTSLEVLNFREEDVGNYSCIAFNVLKQPRRSKAAKLDIAYHETWLEWQGWSECKAACGEMGRRVKYRMCWNEDLQKEGTGCFALSTESEKCQGSCDGDIGRIRGGGGGGGGADAFGSGTSNGGGSQFANSVTMNIDPRPRNNADLHSEQRKRDQAVMVGVISSVIMFVVVALVVVLVLYRKSRSVALHKAYPSGRVGSSHNHIASVYSPNSIVVSKHGETEIIAMPPCSQSMMSSGGYNTSPGQPMYFVEPNGVYKHQQTMYPNGTIMTPNGLSPGSGEVMVPMIPMKSMDGGSHTMPHMGSPQSMSNGMVGDHYSSIANDVTTFNEGEYQLDEEADQSESCNKTEQSGSSSGRKKYERLSNDSGCEDPTSNGALDQGLGGRCLVASKRFYEAQNEILQSVIDEKFVIATFTSSGGRLCLPRSGVSLLVPEGAIAPGKSQEVYLAISNEDRERPKLPDGGTILSPIIVCGPSNAQFLRPVVLSFAHSALNPMSDWTLSVLHGTVVTRSAWQNLLILGEENLNSAAFCQMDEDRCHILIESIHDKYCLVGKSKVGKTATKRLLLSAFAPAALRLQDYNIRIYCVDDTQDALENVIDFEKKSGGVMMDCCKLMHFRDSPDSGLHLALTELSMGWRCKVSNHQQSVPFNHIWCAIQSSLHASFSLEQPKGGNNNNRASGGGGHQWLETKIEAFQMSSYDIHSFTIRLSANDAALLKRGVVDLTPTGVYDPPGLVFRLSSHVRVRICQVMDSPSYSQHDWVFLAKKLNFDRYINYFASKNSPTSHILDLWEARNRQDSAVRELICAIKSMNKHDLAHFVEAELGARVV